MNLTSPYDGKLAAPADVVVSGLRQVPVPREPPRSLVEKEGIVLGGHSMSELLEESDLAALTVPQLVSVVSQGFARHLPTPQLTRDQLSELRSAEIEAARKAHMLDAIMGVKK